MCVGISLALAFFMAYYTYAMLQGLGLVEVINGNVLVIATGIDMFEFIWPLFALGILSGIFLMLLWMKYKNIL